MCLNKLSNIEIFINIQITIFVNDFLPKMLEEDSEIINSEKSYCENSATNKRLVLKAKDRIVKIENYKERIEKPDLDFVPWR